MADNSEALRKAQAIRTLVADYKRANPGATNDQARLKLGIPAPNTPAMKKWHVPANFKPKGAHVAKRSTSRNDIVCDDSGVGVTTRSTSHLTARIGGHSPVVFDAPALGAILQGMMRQLLYNNTLDLVAAYPDMYPELAQRMRVSKRYCAEQEIGAECGKMLGGAIQVFGVTPEQWAAIYVQAKESAPPLPQVVVTRGQIAGGGAPQLGGGDGFRAPIDGPLVETDEFGDSRG